MGKTFDEWWEDSKELWCGILNKEPTLQMRAMAKIIWEESRLNHHTFFP